MNPQDFTEDLKRVMGINCREIIFDDEETEREEPDEYLPYEDERD